MGALILERLRGETAVLDADAILWLQKRVWANVCELQEKVALLTEQRDEREAAAVSLARAEFPLVECFRRWPWLTPVESAGRDGEG